MINQLREEKLKIAKLAYNDIISVIEDWEKLYPNDIHFHWDECITVDDELFHGPELRKEIKNDP